MVELVYTLVLEASFERIAGSSPAKGTIYFGPLAQLAEQIPHKDLVSGSSPLGTIFGRLV